jgi:hypothetical protein
MLMTRTVRRLGAAGLAWAMLLTATPASFGQAMLGGPCCQGCNEGCNRWDCPPKYKYCQEGPPCIWVQCGCPRPVCCPIDAPNWGYFPTCWRPYPWGPNWSHCYGMPPAAQIVPPLSHGEYTPPGEPPTQLPQPRQVTPPNAPALRPGF